MHTIKTLLSRLKMKKHEAYCKLQTKLITIIKSQRQYKDSGSLCDTHMLQKKNTVESMRLTGQFNFRIFRALQHQSF